MPPARIAVTAAPGEPPSVTVNGLPMPAVQQVQVTATAVGVPQVSLVLAAAQVDLDLDGQVTVLRAGPTATEFADRLDPSRLERDALSALDDDLTQGEAFAAAVVAQAVDFDDRG